MNQGVGLRGVAKQGLGPGGVAKQGLGPRGVRRAVLGLSPWRRAARDTAGHARERAASKAQSMGGYWMGGTCEGNRVPDSSRGRPQGASRHLNLPGNVARRERKASGVAWRPDRRPLAVPRTFPGACFPGRVSASLFARPCFRDPCPVPVRGLGSSTPRSVRLLFSSRCRPDSRRRQQRARARVTGDETCGAARTRS